MDSNFAFVGNVTREFGLEFLPNGTPHVKIGLAVNRRRFVKAKNDFEEETSFYDVEAWGSLAENVSASFDKGDRLICVGRIEQQRWEKEGEPRSKVVFQADEIGPSTRFATVEITRNERKSSEGED